MTLRTVFAAFVAFTTIGCAPMADFFEQDGGSSDGSAPYREYDYDDEDDADHDDDDDERQDHDDDDRQDGSVTWDEVEECWDDVDEQAEQCDEAHAYLEGCYLQLADIEAMCEGPYADEDDCERQYSQNQRDIQDALRQIENDCGAEDEMAEWCEALEELYQG